MYKLKNNFISQLFDHQLVTLVKNETVLTEHYLVNTNYSIEQFNSYITLTWAAENGYLEVIKYKHRHGADITGWDNSAIRYAARNGHLHVVKYLHENGADITVSDNEPIRWAILNKHIEVVEYLQKYGPDMKVQDNAAISWFKKLPIYQNIK